MDFNELLERLNRGSLSDISKKLLVYDKRLDNEGLVAVIKKKLPNKKRKWYNSILVGLIVSLIIAVIGWIQTYRINEENKISQEYNHNEVVRNLKYQIVIQKNIGDVALRKYDMLKAYFPWGYIVFTQLSDGEPVYIEYPGLQIMNPKFINLYQKDGDWFLDYVYDEAMGNSAYGGSYSMFDISISNYKIDLNNYLTPQIISYINVDDRMVSLLLLKSNSSSPQFAIGLAYAEY